MICGIGIEEGVTPMETEKEKLLKELLKFYRERNFKVLEKIFRIGEVIEVIPLTKENMHTQMEELLHIICEPAPDDDRYGDPERFKCLED